MSRNHERIGWRALALWRRAVLERDGYRCQSCGKYGNEAHHVKPLAHGGTMDVANGSTRCRDCHIRETRTQLTDPQRLAFRQYVDSLTR